MLWATSVVLPGCPFLGWMIDLTCGVKQQHHCIRITNSVKEDLNIWHNFLREYNGRTLFIPNNIWLITQSYSCSLMLHI